MSERAWTSTGGGYRFGFNGQEKDDEMKGAGNSLDFGARVYDSRLGRWLSVDPFWKAYTMISPFHFALNSPIYFKDSDGNIVVGTDGEEVTMSVLVDADGKETYIFSDNLDRNSDAYRILSSMTLTEEGVQGVSDYLTIPTKFTFTIDPKRTSSHGETVPEMDKMGNPIMSDENPDYYNSVEIIISGGVINGRGRFEATYGEGFTLSDYLGLVGTHEIFAHNTPERIKIDMQYQSDASDRKSLYNYMRKKGPEHEKAYVYGFWEYDNLKRDLDQMQSMIDERYNKGSISEKEYTRRSGIITDYKGKLEDLRATYEADKKEYESN